MATADEPVQTPTRPVGITVLVVIGAIQGLLVVATGVGLLVLSRRSEVAAESDLSGGAVAVAGGLTLLLGLVSVVLALGLARGSNVVRFLYAAIATLEVAGTTYGLLTVRDLRTESIVALVLPVIVLWLLFGSTDSCEFFDR